jgi:hypothetical protein
MRIARKDIIAAIEIAPLVVRRPFYNIRAIKIRSGWNIRFKDTRRDNRKEL